MAETLDQMLEPGERVVYRDPKNWPGQVRPYLIILAALYVNLALLEHGAAAITGHDVGSIHLSLYPYVLAAFFAWQALSGLSGTALLTDRRLLERCGLFRSKTIEVPLGEVERVDAMASGPNGYLKLTRRGGGVLRLRCLGKPQEFAVALAHAAGLPRPALVGRLQNVAEYCVAWGGLPFFLGLMFTVYWFAKGPAPTGGPPGTSGGGIVMLAFIPCFVAGIWLGTYLASLIAMVVLRPIVSAAELRHWLHGGTENESANKLSRRTSLLKALQVKVASRLYGEPMNGPNGGVITHG